MKNRTLLFVFLAGILLNVSGYFIADFIKIYFKFPLFLDTTGTILSAAILGPFVGALTGFTSNLILGVIHNPVNIPFSIVNIIIGITTGIIVKKYGFTGIKSILLCIIFVSIFSALSGALVAFYVFGGVTGAKIDLNIISIMNAGYKLFTSSFLVRLPINLMDKSISIMAAFFIIRNLKPDNQGLAVRNINE
jgi:energy-coupling factor transport system substrate-specific component